MKTCTRTNCFTTDHRPEAKHCYLCGGSLEGKSDWIDLSAIDAWVYTGKLIDELEFRKMVRKAIEAHMPKYVPDFIHPVVEHIEDMPLHFDGPNPLNNYKSEVVDKLDAIDKAFEEFNTLSTKIGLSHENQLLPAFRAAVASLFKGDVGGMLRVRNGEWFIKAKNIPKTWDAGTKVLIRKVDK